MSPTLQTLLTNSSTMSQNLPDEKLLMQLWLNAQLFGIPSDWTTLSNAPQGLKFLSPDQQLNIELYSIAKKLGLPTDGQTLFNFIQKSTGIPSPQAADIPSLITNVWFKNLGAYPTIV